MTVALVMLFESLVLVLVFSLIGWAYLDLRWRLARLERQMRRGIPVPSGTPNAARVARDVASAPPPPAPEREVAPPRPTEPPQHEQWDCYDEGDNTELLSNDEVPSGTTWEPAKTQAIPIPRTEQEDVGDQPTQTSDARAAVRHALQHRMVVGGVRG